MECWFDLKGIKNGISILLSQIKVISKNPAKLVARPKIRLPEVEEIGKANHRFIVPGLNELREESRPAGRAIF